MTTARDTSLSQCFLPTTRAPGGAVASRRAGEEPPPSSCRDVLAKSLEPGGLGERTRRGGVAPGRDSERLGEPPPPLSAYRRPLGTSAYTTLVVGGLPLVGDERTMRRVGELERLRW